MAKTTVKYAIRRGSCFLDANRLPRCGYWYAPAFTAKKYLFDTADEAIQALAARNAEFNPDMVNTPVELVVVEETPGETKREVVELEGVGVVDHSSIQMYALESLIWPGVFLGGEGFSFVTDPTQAEVRDTPGYIFEYARQSGFHLGRFRLVGIRETTTKPTRTVRPLSTYALATD